MLASSGHSANRDESESRFGKLNFSYKFGDENVESSQRRSSGFEAKKGRMEK